MEYVYATDRDFVYTGVEEATLDPLESQLQCKDVYTGPFPYASWDKPPKHDSKTQYALLVDKEWQIRTRLAGNWWNKETAENIFVTDPYDGDLSDYTNIEPPLMHDGDKATFIEEWRLIKGKPRLLAEAKALIGVKIEEHVGKLTNQHNALLTLEAARNGEEVGDFDAEDWRRRFNLFHIIKHQSGSRLKHAIRTAETDEDLIAINASMTDDYENWGK